ncbi:hypothetical protein Syun_031609 [Stephania yunnanensis]|uniref:Uncharacterized protein n=1 Tax=Stephania yunnanensis TaxID=152371 RepID=A0AAP0DVL7_9MAGN
MDTVSESSMAASASEASPSSTTTTPRSTSTPLSAPPSPAASPSHPTPSSNLPRISSIPVTISPPPPAFSSPEHGESKVGDCMEKRGRRGLRGTILIKRRALRRETWWIRRVGEREDGEAVDVFGAKDVERIRGFEG